MSDLLSMVFQVMKQQSADLRKEQEDIIRFSEVAGYAQELLPMTLAEANAEIANISGAALIWISDGRKDSEGAGNGTGCVAVLDVGQAPAVWLRTSDYSAVVT